MPDPLPLPLPIAYGAQRGPAGEVNQDVVYLYGHDGERIAIADVHLLQRAIDRDTTPCREP